MSSPRNLYDVLGVAADATPDEITAAYRKLAMKLHPDRMVRDEDNWEECDANALEFVEVGKAYKILCDEALRADYDKFGFDNGGLMVSERAAKELVMLIVTAMDNCGDLDYANPLNDVKVAIRTTQGNVRRQRAEAERLNHQRQKAMARIRPASPDNPVLKALRERIAATEGEVIALDKHLGLAERMLELLDTYGYEIAAYGDASTTTTTVQGLPFSQIHFLMDRTT